MDIEYEIGLEDLVRLHLAQAEHRGAMSLWLHLLCALILGPIGILGLGVEIVQRLPAPFAWPRVSEIVSWLFCLFFICLPFSLVWNCAWAVRLRLAWRIKHNPSLVGKRSLYVNPNSLFESTLHALNHYNGAEDKQAFLRENTFHFWPWSELNTVQEDPKHILLFAKSGEALIVPISGEPPAEVQAFREALMAHWNSAKTGQPLPSSEEIWPPPPTPGNVPK